MEPTEQAKASPGDRVVIHGHRQGEQARNGEIVEVSGSEGRPPYLVRWEDGHSSSVYPSSDALIQRGGNDG